MSNDELFELVAVLTAKNMALEEEIKRLNKQTDRLWEDLKEYEKDQNDDEEFDFDYPNHYSDPNSAATDLSQKINAVNARLKGTSSKVVELESKVVELGEGIWERVNELDRWAVAQGELQDRVNELLEEKEDNDG